MARRGSRVGRQSHSIALGGAEPRVRRNAQSALTNDDVGPGLEIRNGVLQLSQAVLTQLDSIQTPTGAQKALVKIQDGVDGEDLEFKTEPLTDPADTPASADALRDDLVANLLPELRNNLATLTRLLNEVVDRVN